MEKEVYNQVYAINNMCCEVELDIWEVGNITKNVVERFLSGCAYIAFDKKPCKHILKNGFYRSVDKKIRNENTKGKILLVEISRSESEMFSNKLLIEYNEARKIGRAHV